ncbi:unnamed protein product [Euphydryas editha]|uniref:Uncharacterized protein n=1 Tax=Euphydryas editha TaxID=104508 RepID=A0AAU9U5T4_EUPED|nr:unnamed protein product [Euphydryas editha]
MFEILSLNGKLPVNAIKQSPALPLRAASPLSRNRQTKKQYAACFTETSLPVEANRITSLYPPRLAPPLDTHPPPTRPSVPIPSNEMKN